MIERGACEPCSNRGLPLHSIGKVSNVFVLPESMAEPTPQPAPPVSSAGSTRRRCCTTIRADGPVSRAELARATGLSKPTVNGAVELLLESGYLTEARAGLDVGRGVPGGAPVCSLSRRPGPRPRHRHRREQGAGGASPTSRAR